MIHSLNVTTLFFKWTPSTHAFHTKGPHASPVHLHPPVISMEGKQPNEAPSSVGPADPGLPRALWVQPSPKHDWPAALHSGCNEIMCVCLQGRGVGMVSISLRSAAPNAVGHGCLMSEALCTAFAWALVLAGNKKPRLAQTKLSWKSERRRGSKRGTCQGYTFPHPSRHEIRIWFLGPRGFPQNSETQICSTRSQEHCRGE